MNRDHTVPTLAVACALLLVTAPFAPQWLVFLLALSLAKGLVVLGLVLLMRTGLVSFGQGLYFGSAPTPRRCSRTARHSPTRR
jgi:branched-chain amino acid transport system permease protein